MLAWLLAAACGSPSSSSRRVRTSAETAASWAATLRWVVAAWGEGRVTAPYLRATLDQASQQLGQEARELRRRTAPPGVDLARASSLLDRERLAAQAIAAEVRKGDAPAARARAEELAAVERELRSLSAALAP